DLNGNYWSRDIGYSKVGDVWGIALRETRGHYSAPEEEDVIGPWLFNDGPRWMRIEGIGKIPELLESLSKNADTTAERIRKKNTEAKELAAAVNAAVAEAEEQH